jgi:hypothetical protein
MQNYQDNYQDDITMQTLSDMTVIKLKQLCRDQEFHGFSSCKKKRDLIQFIYKRIELNPQLQLELHPKLEVLIFRTEMFFQKKIKINIQTDTDIDEDTTKNIIQQLYQQATTHGIPVTDIIYDKEQIIDTNHKNKVCGYMHYQTNYRMYWVFNKDPYSFIIKIY